MVESRRYQRVKTDTRAVIRTPSIGEDGLEAKVSELGLGGCMIRTPSPFGVGRVIQVSLDLGAREIRAVARILYEWRERRSEAGVFSGMEFLFLNPEDRIEINAFVEANVA